MVKCIVINYIRGPLLIFGLQITVVGKTRKQTPHEGSLFLGMWFRQEYIGHGV